MALSKTDLGQLLLDETRAKMGSKSPFSEELEKTFNDIEHLPTNSTATKLWLVTFLSFIPATNFDHYPETETSFLKIDNDEITFVTAIRKKNGSFRIVSFIFRFKLPTQDRIPNVKKVVDDLKNRHKILIDGFHIYIYEFSKQQQKNCSVKLRFQTKFWV